MGKYKSVKKAMHNNVLDRINMSLGASSSLDEKKAMREMKEELRKSGAGANSNKLCPDCDQNVKLQIFLENLLTPAGIVILYL